MENLFVCSKIRHFSMIKTRARSLSRLCILLSLSLVLSAPVLAQSLSLSAQRLQFGDVFDDSPDSLLLTLFNPGADTVRVLTAKTYATYGQRDFSVSGLPLAVAPGSSADIWVRCAPRHNIAYNSELLLSDDGGRGELSVDLLANGRYRNTYYNSTFNLAEEDLKTALRIRLGQGYTALSYNEARDRMFMTIDNQRVNGRGATQNTVECVYTGVKVIGYTSRQDAQNASPNPFNTEHTYPQSLFSSNTPMLSDLHHIFPTWDRPNSERGNNPFGVVNTPNWQNGGSKSNGSAFEPRDTQKGAVARAMMYFVLRYQNYGNFLNSQEAILRQWHGNFPPSAVEQRRNADVFTAQGNRNPFADYPQFIERIQSISTSSAAPQRRLLDLSRDTILFTRMQAGTPETYRFVLVNDGNRSLSLRNLQLSDPRLSFQLGSGADGDIEPGESRALFIRFLPAPASPLLADLSFEANTNGFVAYRVPIRAQLLPATGLMPQQAAPAFSVRRQDAQVALDLPASAMQYNSATLLDPAGRVLRVWPLQAGLRHHSLPVGELPAGVYVLQLKGAAAFAVQKFVWN